MPFSRSQVFFRIMTLVLLLGSSIITFQNAAAVTFVSAAPKMKVPDPPTPMLYKGRRYFTETLVRACGPNEPNPGHDVYAVAVKNRGGKTIWRTLLWTWVHPCTQKTIDGKPVALGHIGVLPINLWIKDGKLHVYSNRNQDFEVNLSDGKLLEAPPPVLGTEGP